MPSLSQASQESYECGKTGLCKQVMKNGKVVQCQSCLLTESLFSVFYLAARILAFSNEKNHKSLMYNAI